MQRNTLPISNGSKGYLDWAVHETQAAEAGGN
jgi:hypothetical protein